MAVWDPKDTSPICIDNLLLFLWRNRKAGERIRLEFPEHKTNPLETCRLDKFDKLSQLKTRVSQTKRAWSHPWDSRRTYVFLNLFYKNIQSISQPLQPGSNHFCHPIATTLVKATVTTVFSLMISQDLPLHQSALNAMVSAILLILSHITHSVTGRLLRWPPDSCLPGM